jgi:hypothetical protein
MGLGSIRIQHVQWVKDKEEVSLFLQKPYILLSNPSYLFNPCTFCIKST